MAFRTTQIGGTKASLLVITWIISGESQNLSEVRKVSHSMQPVGRTKCDNMNEMPCPLWVLNKYSFLPSLSLCLRPQVPRTGLEGHPIHLGAKPKERERSRTTRYIEQAVPMQFGCFVYYSHAASSSYCRKEILQGVGDASHHSGIRGISYLLFSWVISLAHSDA